MSDASYIANYTITEALKGGLLNEPFDVSLYHCSIDCQWNNEVTKHYPCHLTLLTV